MAYNYQEEMKLMQEVLTEKEKEENRAKSAQKGKRNPNKKKRYSPSDLKKMAVIVEKMIQEGVTNITHQAKALGVSHWTATKVNKLLRNRARHNAPDILKLLVNPKEAIKRLIPLLDNHDPAVVKQAKQWLLKIADYID